MEKEGLYMAVAKALGESKFALRVDPAKIISMWWIPPLMVMSNVHAAERSSELEAEFDRIRQLSKFVAFRFFGGQPIVAAVIEADTMSAHEIREIGASFNECLIRSLPYTMKSTPTFGRERRSGGVFGILLFVFFDSDRADDFVSSLQAHCYIRDRKQNITLRPCAIDVSRRQVIPESRSWIYEMGTLNSKNFAKLLFGNKV